MTRLPEPAVVRLRAENHDRHLVSLRQSQQRRQAVAGFADEPRFAPHHVDVPSEQQPVGVVDVDRAAVRRDGVLSGPHHRRNALVGGGKRNQAGQVVGGRHVRGIQPRRIGKRRALEPKLERLLVHSLDERRVAAVRHAREESCRRVVGRDERQTKHVVECQPFVRPEIRGRRRVDVAALDGHVLREVGVVFQEHDRGHHFGDARDRPLVLRVLFPEHLTGRGIENDRSGGAHVRHQVAAGVGLVPRRHRLLERAQGADAPPDLSRTRGSAGTRQTRLTSVRRGG